jgi:hypothetical protein
VGFLAPSILLGLIAAALPWLVHLIGKRRATPVKFAAMQLLLLAERRVAARRRLREILLLVARTAIAAVLPFIFARPFAERVSDITEESLSAESAVIVLDDSASMRRLADGTPLFERAKDRARRLLQELPKDAELALLLASEGSEPRVGELSLERTRLLQALESARASARVADYPQALRRAALILAASRRAERRVFVITDMQSAGWGEEGPARRQEDPDLVLVDVAEPFPWTNRAVVGVSAQPAVDLGTGAVSVEAEVADYSPRPAPSLGLTLRIDGAVVAKGFVQFSAPGRQKKTFVHTLAGAAGSHDVEVSIDRDDFSLDDRRWGRLELSQALRVLVINGDARTVLREDEAYFLETALKASDRTTSVFTALPDDVSLGTLDSYNVVFLANVTEPNAPLAAALVRYVQRGGGLFLSVGSRVNIPVWNERLAELLPQPLGVPRTATALPGQVVGETIDDRPAARLAPLDRRHPMLSAFPARGEGLASARFFKFLLLEPVSDTAQAAVILRYDTGAPALVEKSVGKGRVMLLSTTLDREWTDLPIRTGFLPLMQESARRLAGTSERGGTSVLTVGQRRDIALGPDERRLEITKPDGTVWVASKDRASGARVVLFTETDEPGAYRVRTAGADGTLSERPADGFAVNIEPRESNPERLAPDRRPDRKTAPRPEGPPPKRRVELWHGLAALLILLVLVESLLTLRWRRPIIASQR